MMEEKDNKDVFKEELANKEFKELYTRLCEKVPTLFNKEYDPGRLFNHEGGYTIEVTLAHQQILNDFLQQIEDKLDMNVLYFLKDDHGQHYEAMAYSKPYAGEMFIFLIESYQHGLLDKVRMLVYDSYEPMFAQLRQNLSNLPMRHVETIVREERPEVLYTNFFK